MVFRLTAGHTIFPVAFILSLVCLASWHYNSSFAQVPQITDSTLKVELVASGLSLPTSMAFVDHKGSLLVLEKDIGKVVLVSNGTVSEKPVLQVEVDDTAERGLLGIAIINEAEMRTIPANIANIDRTYVFLYFTESDEDGKILGNRVYRYDWNSKDMTLENQTLVLHLPANPGPIHNGGKLAIDHDGNLYAVIGDLNRIGGLLQNIEGGFEADDTSVILRVDLNGSPSQGNPFVSYQREILSRYYAFGIRNSFGLAIDPLTGRLWDADNGEHNYDEINIVYPGFNGGWKKVMGPISRSGVEGDELSYLKGSEYFDPLFSWKDSVGITDIEFLNSNRLGEKYAYNIIVADYNGGDLYYFEVNEERTGLKLDQPEISDTVADSVEEVALVRLGTFSGGVTDIQTGTDGFLYVLTFFDGKIYRIMPNEMNSN